MGIAMIPGHRDALWRKVLDVFLCLHAKPGEKIPIRTLQLQCLQRHGIISLEHLFAVLYWAANQSLVQIPKIGIRGEIALTEKGYAQLVAAT